jgi:hypothetical protein
MFIVSAFCMAVIWWCLYRNLDTRVAESAVTMAFLTLGGIVGSYVFGATWEDVQQAKLEHAEPQDLLKGVDNAY